MPNVPIDLSHKKFVIPKINALQDDKHYNIADIKIFIDKQTPNTKVYSVIDAENNTTVGILTVIFVGGEISDRQFRLL